MKRLIVTLAAALAAMVIAAPVAAQTTGTIKTWLGTGFTMPTAVTLNSNREWEVQYEVTLDGNGGAIDNAIRQCEADPRSNDCEIKSPYIMRYGAIDVYSNCDPRGYAECNRLRTACNNDPSTTWEQSRNRCIPASN